MQLKIRFSYKHMLCIEIDTQSEGFVICRMLSLYYSDEERTRRQRLLGTWMRRWESCTGVDVREIFRQSGMWMKLAGATGFLIKSDGTYKNCCDIIGFRASWFEQYHVWFVFRRCSVRIFVRTPTVMVDKSFIVRSCRLLHFGLLFGCEDRDDILLRNVG